LHCFLIAYKPSLYCLYRLSNADRRMTTPPDIYLHTNGLNALIWPISWFTVPTASAITTSSDAELSSAQKPCLGLSRARACKNFEPSAGRRWA
jgi:hypothetical protein